MTFSFIHPSFMRPEQSVKCYEAWYAQSDKDVEMQWLVALSSNDREMPAYREAWEPYLADLYVTETRSMVAAANEVARHATGDVLILVSDDMYPCERWETRLREVMAGFDGPVVLQVDDGIRSDIMTLPIMNRAAYERLGYLYHPSYISMFADNDLAETAKAHGMYQRADQLMFDHRHYTVGKAPHDNTYRHENSGLAWQLGQTLFNNRKAAGFPLR